MPSSSEPVPPSGANQTKFRSADAPLTAQYALAASLILALLGTIALAVDIVGLALTLMWLCYGGSIVVGLGAIALAVKPPRRRRGRASRSTGAGA